MRDALLVTPLPPQPTGLADYAKRIIHLTCEHINWTVAYPSDAEPLPGVNSIPIPDLGEDELRLPKVYQIGNSPHCAQVIDTILKYPGKALYHETNLHHVLRQIAHSTGDWKTYSSHVEREYGENSHGVLKRMGKRAKSFPEYDMRLRKNPLTGMLVDSSTRIAVLSDTAKMKLEKLLPGREILRMGFLADFLKRVPPPEERLEGTVIGIAGTYHYGRNWEAMSEAVAGVRRFHKCILLAAGAGWPETGLDWIHVTGRLSDLEFRNRIEQFDIALDLRHDTCSETSGSMMDIMRSGIPAVISDQGTFRDLPADAVVRIPTESGSAGAAEALSYLIENPDVLRSTGEKAEEYFRKVSDPGTCLKEWLHFLEDDPV